MKPSIARAVIAITILALAMLTSVVPDLTGRSGVGSPTGNYLVATRRLDTAAFAQDEEDNAEDDEDNDEDDDNAEEDDGDNDEDGEDDNDENDCDDVDDNSEDEDEDNLEDEDNSEDDENSEDDDNAEDDDNVDCEDEDDSDNDEDDADNEDEEDVDDEEDTIDDEEVDDDEDVADDVPTTAIGQTGPPCAPNGIVSTAPDTEVQALTTGRDLWLALPGDRLSVQVFADTPAGICLALRLVDPLGQPTVPGVQVGGYIFQLEAFDELGTALQTLPAQVSVNVHYADADVAGVDEQLMTLSRLDPLDQTWRSPPGVLLDPVTNWVWVLTTDTGVFVAHVP